MGWGDWLGKAADTAGRIGSGLGKIYEEHKGTIGKVGDAINSGVGAVGAVKDVYSNLRQGNLSGAIGAGRNAINQGRNTFGQGIAAGGALRGAAGAVRGLAQNRAV